MLFPKGLRVQVPPLPPKLFMDVKSELAKNGLNPNNSVVIGSGILGALNLRPINDIDTIVTTKKFDELSSDSHFTKGFNHGREALFADGIELFTIWVIDGKTWYFNDLLKHSVIIDDVRYNSVELLLKVKKSWIAEGDPRRKDVNDIKLMEHYLRSKNPPKLGGFFC
jgi:hypothetical protein